MPGTASNWPAFRAARKLALLMPCPHAVQIVDGLRLAHHVPVLGVHVEQICLVRRGVPIADRVSDDDRDEPIRATIDARGTHATACRKAGMNQCVDSPDR